ncbi:auxin efflux carrier component 2-like [Abrus precatorius]|uniref:Auxin efflux carrier component n=1 Tax=Abrus precatorius TaxID=3816 RepID=A0A8B8JUE7_ABRPR|nr:auxin efflux carrier component 2-like [Abrus precatorius]
MITGKDIYYVVSALVPLYSPMILAYCSVKWWKIFTPEQCAGINRFVAVFAVPFLSFRFISSNDPLTMNLPFIAADTLQKVVILCALLLWNAFTKSGSIDWTLTLFSLSTIPNTLVVGVPLLSSMYGGSVASLMGQIVVLQCVVWLPVIIFLYEYRGAKQLISEKFPETAGSITSFKVDSDVSSFNGKEPLQADVEVKENGELHVVVRSASSNNYFSNTVTGLQSCREPMQICSCFETLGNLQNDETFQVEIMSKMNKEKFCRSKSCNDITIGVQHELIYTSPGLKAIGDKEVGIVEGIQQYYLSEGMKGVMNIEEIDANKKQQMPPTIVMTKLILTTVCRNLMTNPNTYASVLGLAWSFITFRWNIEMPSVINGSITVLSNTGLGMAMFSLGLFMALQPKIIACGKSLAALAMVARFLVGPAVMAATSILIGIRGVLLHVSIVQAALPQAIATFVFAKEYNVHADILSTSVVFGTVISLFATIIYYVLLEL